MGNAGAVTAAREDRGSRQPMGEGGHQRSTPGGGGGAGQAQVHMGSSALASSASYKCGERRCIFHLQAEFNERHDEGSP